MVNVQISGNSRIFVAVFFLLWIGGLSASLTITDTQGDAIQTAVIGQRFFCTYTQQKPFGSDMRLLCDNGVEVVQGPSIEHVTHYINGKKSVSYTARFTLQAKSMSKKCTISLCSGSQKIAASDIAIEYAAQAKSKIGVVEIVRLEPAVYQTQVFTLVIRAYLPKNIKPEDNLSLLLPDGLTLHSISGPHVDSKSYAQTVYRWSAQVHAKKPGEYIIPSIALSVFEQNGNSFFALFNTPIEHQLFSNALPCAVKALIPPACSAWFIGKDVKINQSLSHASASAKNLTIEIDGPSNAYMYSHLPVVIPGVRVHTGKSVAFPDRVRYEYLLQPLDSGEYEVPSQTIALFDPQTASWDIREIPALPFSVALTAHKAQVFDDTPPAQQMPQSSPQQDDPGIEPLAFLTTIQELTIPDAIFWVLVLCGLLMLFGISYSTYCRRLYMASILSLYTTLFMVAASCAHALPYSFVFKIRQFFYKRVCASVDGLIGMSACHLRLGEWWRDVHCTCMESEYRERKSAVPLSFKVIIQWQKNLYSYLWSSVLYR